MGVVFESVIKFSNDKEWFIELKDTVDGRVEVCKDLDEYAEKVEKLGEDYGGHIDEIKWSKDDNVPPFIMDEIRQGMAKFQSEMDELKAQQEQ